MNSDLILYNLVFVQLINSMEINLKIKFDKHHKTNTWDKTDSYFLEPPLKRHQSPKSMREEVKHKHTRRESQPVISTKKSNTARKNNDSKPKL